MSTQPKTASNSAATKGSRRSDFVYVITMVVIGILVCVCGLLLATDGRLPGLDFMHDKVTGGLYSGGWD